jgi:diguanylate cyclase (GGDEF)-like protein
LTARRLSGDHGSVAQILVLEGDTFARNLYCEFLRAEGFEVRAEPDTPLALAALARQPAEVLVAKIGTSEPYGQALLAEARRSAPGVDLIALVERDSPDGAARALREGASEYLLKPVTRAALALAVRRCLELQQLLIDRPALAQELALYRRCKTLAYSGDADAVAERTTASLCEHARAEVAVALSLGEHGEMVACAHVGLSAEQAGEIAAGWRERHAPRRIRPPVLRDLPDPLAIEVPGRFTVALFGARETPGLEAELALLARFGGVGAELAARYGAAAGCESALDPLSGLYQQGYLCQVLDDELLRARAGGPAAAVLAIDLDAFREINQAHGHLLGAHVLAEVARILTRCVREIDVVARTGGDEFGILLLHTDATGARGAAERVRRAMESHVFLVREGMELRLTVSIGVAGYPEHGTSAQALCEAAERAVHTAKRDAKNCVVVAKP